MILVISHEQDPHARAVLAELHELGHAALLFDTAGFPGAHGLRQEVAGRHTEFHATLDGKPLDLGSCGAAWWRRPQPFRLAPGMPDEVASFAYAECNEAIQGLWHALDVGWINPPHLDEIAHHKPYQLRVAAELGLRVPHTLITNDPDAVRRFAEEVGRDRVVYKTFLASEACWRETRLMRAEEWELLEHVHYAPVIFQEYVPASADLRVTIVGERVFAAAVRAPKHGYQVDYRMDLANASFEPTALPAGVERKLLAFMRRLGLVYGALDLRRTPQGDCVFLEVNPAGEWLFVEERTGLPIARAMGEQLIAIDRSRRYPRRHEAQAVVAGASAGSGRRGDERQGHAVLADRGDLPGRRAVGGRGSGRVARRGNAARTGR